MKHSRPSTQAILFDLDGTLVDSYRLYLESYSHAIEPVLGRSPSLGEGLYEGVREMLTGLATAGYPLGIVSWKARRLWDVMEASFAPGIFDVVVTEDDVAEARPHPEGLLAAARALSIEPGRIAYIADSRSDLAAGRAAGMVIGAALWPKSEPADRAEFLAAVAELAPDYLFERPGEVTREFAKWC